MFIFLGSVKVSSSCRKKLDVGSVLSFESINLSNMLWYLSCIRAEVALDNCHKMETTHNLPPREFLYKVVSQCSPADGYYGCSAVIPSLPMAINWLRDCVRENPSLRLQVRIHFNMFIQICFDLMQYASRFEVLTH